MKKTIALFAFLAASLPLLMGPVPSTPPGVRVIRCTTACSAASLRVGDSVILVKQADENRASTVTLTNDTDLQITTANAVESFEVTAAVGWTANAAGGFFYQFAGGFPSISQVVVDRCNATVVVQSPGVSNPSNTCLNSGGQAYFTAQLSQPSALNFRLLWAQNTSNVANSTVKAGSYIRLLRIQ